MFRLITSSRVSAVSAVIRQVRFNSTAGYTEAIAKIRDDLKLNFRLKADVIEKNVIRSILTEVKNLEINNHNKGTNTEYQLYDLFAKMIKERKDSAAEYMKKGNPDRFHQLGLNELRECDYIEKYLNILNLASDEEVDANVKKNYEKIKVQDIYKNIPMKSIEKDWNCSKSQVKESVNRVLNELS
ncbi:hypothetical protein PACTADRAFT_49363 [Pachysolen tannophilus NRRL Y-2460]|uniref:Altered inheritance of mitochondria protein 41 n=1 Tax=Pachysolen tannophilus NRRL Y-2460 TaxID=669874 RepID=A0A1E4TVX1_PACTA|nr:hypothetical protein PACTADRAFT_49363 [Pachysolen tannophilus NRRL Y-2460]